MIFTLNSYLMLLGNLFTIPVFIAVTLATMYTSENITNSVSQLESSRGMEVEGKLTVENGYELSLPEASCQRTE